MLQEAIHIITGIVSVYFLVLTIYAGLVCIFFVGPYIQSGGFDKEAAIARYGGIAYIIGSILLFGAARLFL